MDNKRIIILQHFFSTDVQIKREMYDAAPPSPDQFLDEESLSKYTDKLDDTLMYIFTELKSNSLAIFGSESPVLKRIDYLEQVTINNFYNCGLDINSLRQFYKTFISNMDPNFINSVKAKCVGYASGETNSIEMAVSINEVLHFLHSYVINNDDILKSIPLLNQKTNDNDEDIYLRGVSFPIFEQLFEMFPTYLDCGTTDMVAINKKKLIMMVRDRGHALSIEISLNNPIARIEYFIPKLCNIEMINKLPGINKVNQNSVGATGVIEVPINDLPEVLFDFISKVPTDSDMFLEYNQGMRQ